MKNMLKLLVASMLLGSMVGMAQAAQTCNRSDWFCYEGGPSQNLTTYGRLDGSGNFTANGAITTTALTPGPYTAAQVAALTPANSGQIIVISNPGAFNAGGVGLCVSTATTLGSFIAVSSATALTVCK